MSPASRTVEGRCPWQADKQSKHHNKRIEPMQDLIFAHDGYFHCRKYRQGSRLLVLTVPTNARGELVLHPHSVVTHRRRPTTR